MAAATEDALAAITQKSLSQNYSVALSGGNDVGKFRASFLASNNKGFLKKTALDKYLATINGTYKFLDKRLTLDFNIITGNYVETLTSVSNTAGSTGNIISSALSWNPTLANWWEPVAYIISQAMVRVTRLHLTMHLRCQRV
jgi:hypothetical protein